MSVLVKNALKRAARVVNSTLGVLCQYTPTGGAEIIPDINIVIDRNKKVNDEFGMLAGYRVEASMLKIDIVKPKRGDTFTDDEGYTFKVNTIQKETSGKWYVSVVEVIE